MAGQKERVERNGLEAIARPPDIAEETRSSIIRNHFRNSQFLNGPTRKGFYRRPWRQPGFACHTKCRAANNVINVPPRRIGVSEEIYKADPIICPDGTSVLQVQHG